MRAEGFFSRLDVLYGGLGIGKWQILIKIIFKFVLAVNIFKFLLIKALDPDRYSASKAGSGSNEYGSETLVN